MIIKAKDKSLAESKHQARPNQGRCRAKSAKKMKKSVEMLVNSLVNYKIYGAKISLVKNNQLK